jgi:hypothetical protein
MTIRERQEIAEAILNELHFRRYSEAIKNGCSEKEAMTLADNWELYKDAESLFKFYADLPDVVWRSELLPERINPCINGGNTESCKNKNVCYYCLE